jgi:hypothetical protein
MKLISKDGKYFSEKQGAFQDVQDNGTDYDWETMPMSVRADGKLYVAWLDYSPLFTAPGAYTVSL